MSSSRLLEKSAGFILASHPGAVKRETRVSQEAAALPAEQRVLARRGWAGEKTGLLEHPTEVFPYCSTRTDRRNFRIPT